jgi:transposase InsO family protein
VSERYAFIEAEKAGYPIVKICVWLDVSPSGFYEWRDRPLSPTAQRRVRLTRLILAIFDDSDGTYGYRRIHASLARQGDDCGPELVRDIMRELGLVPCQPRRWRPTTTRAGRGAEVVPDLVNRNFTANAQGTKMVGDITYLRTWEGFAYLATVIDCCTKECIGYAIADHMRAELVIDALRMAARNRPLESGAIFHTDHGSQYLSSALAEILDHSMFGIQWDGSARVSTIPRRNHSTPPSKWNESTGPCTQPANTPARMWPATSSSATILNDFTRLWAIEHHTRLTSNTKTNDEQHNNISNDYPETSGRPRPGHPRVPC